MADFKPHGTRLLSLSLEELKSADLISALDLWRNWCGDRVAPAWADVNLSAFPPKLLPMATVVDVIDGGKDFKYRYWGSDLSRLFKREETGLLLSEHVVNQSGHIRFSQFWEVVVQIRPLAFMTIFERVEGVTAEKINLRLPVVDEAGAVDKIISLSVMDRTGIQDFEDLSDHWQAEIGG